VELADVFRSHGEEYLSHNNIPGEYVSYDGKKYYYCETTTVGNNVGNIPLDITGTPEIVIKI